MKRAAAPTLAPWRLRLVMALLALCSFGLVLRLGQLQLVEQEWARVKAQGEHEGSLTQQPRRGDILDRNGYPLASSIPIAWVSLEWEYLRDPVESERVLKELADRLELPLTQLQTLPRPEPRTLIPVQVPYLVARELAKKVEDGKLPGVIVEMGERRVNPEGNLAAHLLGFVGRDPVGLTGIEADFNRDLAGVAGVFEYERDGLGKPIPFGAQQLQEPQRGSDLVLTLDRSLQRAVERILDEAMKRHQAAGGTLIIMQPSTGEILAMASRPAFDLVGLDLLNGSPGTRVTSENPAITELYEPGSIFKVVTMAAALDSGLVTPETTYVDAGAVRRYGWTIDTWNHGHYGQQTMTQLLQTSNNIGAVWLGERLGSERFYRYVRLFGFGQPTGVGVREVSGNVRTQEDMEWRPIDLLTNTYGQGISVTPLQMITAVSAVANGGLLMRPTLVKEVRGPGGIRALEPVVVRRVLRPESAELLRRMLNASAEQLPSRYVTVPGYHVAGKTGTANIPGPSGYTEKVIVSFVGFAPYDDPQVVVLVKIVDPKGEALGSVVAAPIFGQVVQETLPYLRVPPADITLAARGSRKP